MKKAVFCALFLFVISFPAFSATSDPQSKPVEIELFIGAEDLLEISVFELPQFSLTSRVSGDGTVTMPLIGTVEVRGLTKAQAEKKIADALEAKYVNNPSVSINIKEYKSRQISVLGSVKNPGAYYVLSKRSLLEIITDAGGLTENAGTRCYVFRAGSSKIEIDLADLMTNGNAELNIEIHPGDVINIPQDTKVVVYVLGAVRSPGAIELTKNLPVTLLAAIARAGGLTERANSSSVQIRRKGKTGEEIVLKENLKEILNGKKSDITLLSGDVVHVPESFF
jgi:polysaccharide export outer membrane protein